MRGIDVKVERTVAEVEYPEPGPEVYTPDPEYADYSDGELAELHERVGREVRRRDTMARALEVADEAARAWHAASGRVEGAPWVEPQSATSSFPLGWIAEHEGQLWRSARSTNMRQPGEGDAWEPVEPDPAPDAEEYL